MNYGVSDSLNRGRSEVLSVLTNFQNGQALANTLGRPVYFPAAAYYDREVVELRAIPFEFLKGKGLPTIAQLANITATFVDYDGDYIIEDIPLSRLPYLSTTGRLLRNFIWRPRVLDMQHSFIRTTGAIFNGQVSLEIIYRN